MAKRKTTQSPPEFGFASIEDIEAIEASLRVTAWRRDKRGKNVTTHGIDEEGLGISEVICGWCEGGFYFDPSVHTRAHVDSVLDAIDWDRVSFLKKRFDLQVGDWKHAVYVGISYCYVTEARYKRLMRHAKKAVSKEVFTKEVREGYEQGYGTGKKNLSAKDERMCRRQRDLFIKMLKGQS